MTTLRQAAEQALEALEEMKSEFRALDLPYGSAAYAKANRSSNALRAALAQPEQEPVALPDWFNHAFPGGKLEAVGFHMPTPRAYAEEMYKRWKSRIGELKAELAGLTDAQRKPLTEGEIEALLDKYGIHSDLNTRGCFGFVRAVEAAHGIKENT